MKNKLSDANLKKIVNCIKTQRANLLRLSFFDLSKAKESKKDEKLRYLKLIDMFISDSEKQLKILQTMRQNIKDNVANEA